MKTPEQRERKRKANDHGRKTFGVNDPKSHVIAGGRAVRENVSWAATVESPKRRIMVHGFRATAWFGSPAERKRFEANEARRVGVRETETTEPSPEFHLSIEDATVLDRATARDDVAHGTGGDASSVKPAVEVVP